MESQLDWHQAKALLEWQIELGATEAILDAPVDRFELINTPSSKAPANSQKPTPAVRVEEVSPVSVAEQAAAAAMDRDSLKQAMAQFEHCQLKRGARQLVFADGNPNAKVMIIGEGPGRDEDMEGRPFVGRAGQLLDRMFAAIGLSRMGEGTDDSLYITNVVPWRPPQNRDPSPIEIEMMLPFLRRHIALVQPDVIVAMGNIPCQALLGKRGVTKLRGQWASGCDVDVMPMFHPAYLLRNPLAKREAWQDLQAVQKRIR